MEWAPSDEVGPGNRPNFFCAKAAIGGQALCLPSPKGRFFNKLYRIHLWSLNCRISYLLSCSSLQPIDKNIYTGYNGA